MAGFRKNERKGTKAGSDGKAIKASETGVAEDMGENQTDHA